MQIVKWENSKYKKAELVQIMKKASQQLPTSLESRIVIKNFVEKLIEFGKIYIVEDDEGIPGGIMGFYANDKVTKIAYLSIISLLPSVRGLGIGRKLIRTLIYDCQFAGMKEVSLKVDKNNNIAISCYKKEGFQVMGECGKQVIMTAKI